MGGGLVIAVLLIVLAVVAVAAVALAGASVRVLREYERAVIFRLGRVIDQKGPGLVLLIPGIDRMVRVTLRTITLRIPHQDVITRDNVPVKVAAVVSERERLNESLQQIIDEQTEPWGIKVTIVEIKDVEIPDRMQHAMARQAEAERNRRAKVINAEGEYQAAGRLAEAADVIRPNPVTIQLRYLQALSEISSNQGSTIVFPLPIDLIRPLLEAGGGDGEREEADSAQLSLTTGTEEQIPAALNRP